MNLPVTPRVMASTVSANLVNVLETRGPSLSASAACAGGAYNLLLAAQLIESGFVDAALAYDWGLVNHVVPHADLRLLDPVATVTLITRMHGTLAYESLFAWDSKFESKPMMVETHSVSPDNLTYTFKLRSGLKFHDGQPVRSADCIASIDQIGRAHV